MRNTRQATVFPLVEETIDLKVPSNFSFIAGEIMNRHIDETTTFSHPGML